LDFRLPWGQCAEIHTSCDNHDPLGGVWMVEIHGFDEAMEIVMEEVWTPGLLFVIQGIIPKDHFPLKAGVDSSFSRCQT